MTKGVTEPGRRPMLVAVAGPDGAGKTTFTHAHLRPVGLRVVDADVLTAELGLDDHADERSSRFSHTMTNLDAAIRELPHVRVFDNSDLGRPFRLVSVFRRGHSARSTPDRARFR